MPVLADELARLQAHRWQISDLSFSPDGTRLASAGWDKEVNVWELGNLERVLNLAGVHRVPVTAVSWIRPNGLILCTGSADGTAALWNAETGAHLSSLADHSGWVLGTDFSATGSFLATACWDSTVRIWDPGSETVVQSLEGHGAGVWSVKFHPSSSQLCTASEDKSVRLWDARTNRPAGKLYGQHTEAVYCAAWSPDGGVIATGSADNKICIWEPRQQAVINTIYAHQDTVKSLAFNPHIENVAVPVLASAGGYKLCLSDPRPSHRADILSVTLHKPGKEIEAVAVSPDGSLLVSGGRDGLIVLMTLMVPSIIPRSESHYTSLTSHVLRKSRAIRDRSYIYDATADGGIPEESEEEEENEWDDSTAIEETDHLSPLESVKATEKPKSYTRLKRRSRFEEKETELADYATVKKKKFVSAKTARERRTKGKSYDIPTMVQHLSAAVRVYGPEEPESSSDSEEEHKTPEPEPASAQPQVDILSHIKAWSNPEAISSLPPPRRKISILPQVTGKAKSRKQFFEAGDSIAGQTVEEEESEEELKHQHQLESEDTLVSRSEEGGEGESIEQPSDLGNSYRLEDLMALSPDDSLLQWETSDTHFTPQLPGLEEEGELYSDDDTVSMI